MNSPFLPSVLMVLPLLSSVSGDCVCWSVGLLVWFSVSVTGIYAQPQTDIQTICLQTERQTDTHNTDRPTDRPTDPTDRPTDRQTDRQTDICLPQLNYLSLSFYCLFVCLSSVDVYVCLCQFVSADVLDLGKCIHLYDETQGTIKHKRFRRKLSSSGVRRQIIIDSFLYINSLSVFFFASFFFYYYLSIFFTPDEDNFLSKALVFHCFIVFRHIGEYISLDLFYFVNLTSSCSLIPHQVCLP